MSMFDKESTIWILNMRQEVENSRRDSSLNSTYVMSPQPWPSAITPIRFRTFLFQTPLEPLTLE